MKTKNETKDPDSPPLHMALLRMVRHGLLLGILFAIAGSFSTSYAQGTTIPCGAQESQCRVGASFSSLSVINPNASGAGVTGPTTPAFGALIYTDFKQLEHEAHIRMARSVGVRESISPYQGRVGFDQFLSALDTEAGLSQVYTPTTPYGTGISRNALLHGVETDLIAARDIYAFLAVFAPEARFRSDPDYTANAVPVADCGVTDQENPDPEDTQHEGLVLPSVVDWCDFKARLRQSVREAALIRMMVGQQFMVEALGMNFGGEIIGGEVYVRREVAQLRAAQFQFKTAQQTLAGALTRVAGDGCFVSDFYTQSEWSLLTRAADSQASTQFLIGTRLSYLNSPNKKGVAQAKADAVTAYRRGTSDGYVTMLGLAALGRTDRKGCAHGEHPDDDAVAAMALNMLDAQQKAHDISSGRNIFGFDVTFTPTRPYKSSTTADCDTNAVGNRGLWDEAKCATDEAAKLQTIAEQAQRDYNQSQTKLQDSAKALIQELDKDIDNTVGCTRRDLPNDEDFFGCATQQADMALVCIDRVQKDEADKDSFDKCMHTPGFHSGNDAETALQDLRGAYLAYQEIKLAMENINKRVAKSQNANAIIKRWIGFSGALEAASRVTQALLDGADCEDFDNEISAVASAAACGTTATANTLAQGAAGALSTAADVEVQDTQAELEIANLVLDQSELRISAASAYQAYLSKLSDTTGIMTALQRDIAEDIRQHAYFKSSPANDPSFRIVRDSARLDAANALELAAKMSYLAARRAEYEYALSLSASGFSISDIYRARSPQNISTFLTNLRNITDNPPGGTLQESQPISFTISVAKEIVPLADDATLIAAGFTTPAQIDAERTRLFRKWVAENTKKDPTDGTPILEFPMTTSLLKGGIFDRLIPKSDLRWRMVIGGIGSPDPQNTGLAVNITSAQPNLSYRPVEVVQGGLVHMRSQAGCVFDYHLIAPAVLLGYQWSKSQNPEAQASLFNANVNNAHADSEAGFRTKAYEGRAVSATDWQVRIYSNVPGLPAMDLQQMTDIQLRVSAAYVTRTAGTPEAGECSRLDF